MRILVIGHPEAVMGFSLVGVSGVQATSADEANQAIDDAIASEDIGIVLVTGDVVAMVRSRMDQLQLHSTVPLFVELPAPVAVQPEQPSLNDIVFRAIGVKL